MLLGELDLDGSKVDKTFKNLEGKVPGLMSKLTGVGAKLAGVAIALGGFAVFEKLATDAIELGGTLNDLSLRTGETVSDLVLMREAFQESGLGADAVEPFLLKLQNVLGGVNEEGGKTTDTLQSLGLSAKELSHMSGLQQLEAFKKGLAGVADQGSKVQALKNLFGKSGGQMLSLLGDEGALGKGSSHAQKLAAIAERAVPALDDLGDAMDGAKLHIQELAFGALTDLAPKFKSLFDSLDQVDFVAIGQGFADVVTPLVSVTQALVDFGVGIGNALDWILDHTMGTQAPALSQYDKAGVEHRRALAAKKDTDKGLASIGISALQKVGLGGGFGGGDAMLSEARRHTQILIKISDRLGPVGTNSPLLDPPHV